MNKVLVKEYKKLIKDRLSIYFKLKNIYERLNLKKYLEYEIQRKLRTRL